MYFWGYTFYIKLFLCVVFVSLLLIGLTFSSILISYSRKRKYRRAMRLPSGEEIDRIEKNWGLLEVEKRPPVYFCAEINKPVVMGRLHPALLLPERVYSSEELQQLLMEFAPRCRRSVRCGLPALLLFLLGAGAAAGVSFYLQLQGYSLSWMYDRLMDGMQQTDVKESNDSEDYYINAEEVYGGWEEPPAFNGEALADILKMEPVDSDIYYDLIWEQNYDSLEETGVSIEAVSPYQTVIDAPDRFLSNLDQLIYAYTGRYCTDLMWQQISKSDTTNKGAYMGQPSWYLLAGDAKEFAAAVLFDLSLGDHSVQAETVLEKGWGQLVNRQSGPYVLCSWTVHVRMTEEYVQELVGIARTEDVLEGYRQKYEDVGFLDKIPSYDLTELSPHRARISDGKLSVTYDGGSTWAQVPVSMDSLSSRGGMMEQYGQNYLESSSYYVSPEKTMFLFGGDGRVPLTALVSDDQGKNWGKYVISETALSGRRIFMGYLPDSDFAWAVVTGERVVYQEITTFYTSSDGGKIWKEEGAFGPGDGIHSLTIGAAFTTPDNAWLCIRSSNAPEVWRTDNGGITWSSVMFPDVPEYYGMAYAPEFHGEEGVIYIGMEDYSETGGVQCRYVSHDAGKSWSFDGMVMRRQ